MPFQLKEEKINSLLATLSIVFAVVVVVLLCIVLISGNDFRNLPYKEFYDPAMVTCYFLSWIIAIFAVYKIVKYKKQKEIYLPFGIFGFFGVIVALRLKDNDKANHDRATAKLNKEFSNKSDDAPMRSSSASSAPYTPPPPPPPREEIINAKSIQVVTTDGKIYNIKTGDGSGDDSPPPPPPVREAPSAPSGFDRPASSSSSPPPMGKPKAIPAKPTMIGNLTNKLKSYLPKMPKIPLPKIPLPKISGRVKMNNWGTWFRIPRLRLKPLSKQNYMDEDTFSLDPKSRLQKGHYVRKTRQQDNIGAHESKFRSMKRQENIWGPDGRPDDNDADE